MSVIVIAKMTVDPANLEKLWTERKADFQAIANDAKAAGAVHHRWGFTDGAVVIIDEWSDGESFQKFFDGNPKIGELMQAGGVQGPPEIQILDAKTGPDEF